MHFGGCVHINILETAIINIRSIHDPPLCNQNAMHLVATTSKKLHSLYIGKKTDAGKQKKVSMCFECRGVNDYRYALKSTFNMREFSVAALIPAFA